MMGRITQHLLCHLQHFLTSSNRALRDTIHHVLHIMSLDVSTLQLVGLHPPTLSSRIQPQARYPTSVTPKLSHSARVSVPITAPLHDPLIQTAAGCPASPPAPIHIPRRKSNPLPLRVQAGGTLYHFASWLRHCCLPHNTASDTACRHDTNTTKNPLCIHGSQSAPRCVPEGLGVPAKLVTG